MHEVRRLKPGAVCVIAICCSSFSIMSNPESCTLKLYVRIPIALRAHSSGPVQLLGGGSVTHLVMLGGSLLLMATCCVQGCVS